jgi:hypothetical protein
MAEDDAAYRRSVRNTVIVLAAVVVVIAAALLVPPLVNPIHEQFNNTTSVASPYGFVLSLRLNGSQLTAGQGETIMAWVNSTSSVVANVSAASNWPVGPQGLWTRICTNGWPLGVGLMSGYYTSDNYTLGSLVHIPMPLVSCPISISTPGSFLLQPLGSTAIVKVGGTLAEWDLTSTLGLAGNQFSSQKDGAYTAIAVDEWGDLAIVHFRVNQ